MTAITEADWDEIDRWVADRERAFAEPISEPPTELTADEISAVWLTIWFEARAWTIDEGATILAGLVPRQGDLCLPGLRPRGTVYGEGGEPTAVRVRDRILQPEALRQKESGPCALRIIWRKEMAETGRTNAGLLISHLDCRQEATFPPRVILQAAAELGIVPPWTDAAHADPALTAMLPPPLALVTRPGERPAVPTVKEGVELADGDGRGLGATAKKYPYWSHMIVFAENALKGISKPNVEDFRRVGDQLRAIENLRQKDKSKPDEDTVKTWHRRYGVTDELTKAVRRFRALGLERSDPPAGLPDLTDFR